MDFSKLNLKDHQLLAREIVLEAINRHFKDRRDFQVFRNTIIKKRKGQIFHNLYFIKAYQDLIKENKIKPNPEFLALIQKRSVRTMSGVAPVTVLTKPYPCPGACVYCPTDVRMPKSYLPSQPAAQRAFRQQFDPYTQVYVRLKALRMTGHEVSKVELRVIGGTWSAYPKQYQIWFLKRCLQAMNEFTKKIETQETDIIKKIVIKSEYGQDEVHTLIIKSLTKGAIRWDALVKQNETSQVRCIGINIETRPDWINKTEVHRLRYLGITKVELGVQTLNDDVYKITKRGHTVHQTVLATRLLKDAGFKIGYHMMPNLPGSNPKMDREMIHNLFNSDLFQPDYLKIYPCVVLPKTQLSKMYQDGEFKPYSDAVLSDILQDNILAVPEWCRLDRLARDLPANELEAGFTTSNIRQVLESRLTELNLRCREIRCREIKGDKFDVKNINFIQRHYLASRGEEYFLSYEESKLDKIIGLLRLRFPYKTFMRDLTGVAIIREVHVYGRQIAVGKNSKTNKQHQGWGSKLLIKAEEIAKNKGFNKIAIIAGIGTRGYYSKRGYQLCGTYMLKTL